MRPLNPMIMVRATSRLKTIASEAPTGIGRMYGPISPRTKAIGIIEAISYTGAHPILIVRDNGEEFMIPLVDDIMVDRQGSRIIIDPPPGLLDINRAER